MTDDISTDNKEAHFIFASTPKPHRYRCRKGHEWVAMYQPTMLFSVGDSGKKQTISGFVCMLCVGESALRQFSVEDMGEVVEEEKL